VHVTTACYSCITDNHTSQHGGRLYVWKALYVHFSIGKHGVLIVPNTQQSTSAFSIEVVTARWTLLRVLATFSNRKLRRLEYLNQLNIQSEGTAPTKVATDIKYACVK
jgi:hypothetical protein